LTPNEFAEDRHAVVVVAASVAGETSWTMKTLIDLTRTG